MPDRYDNSFSRRPAPLDGNTGRRNEPPAQAEDDPLVELARIVSGNSSFDDIVGGRQPVAAPVVRSAQQPNVRDTSFDLESELMNDLQTSFDPAVRLASGRPLQVEPQPPRAVQSRDEGFDHMRLRPGAPAAPPQWQAAQPPRQAEPRHPQPEPRYTQDPYVQPALEEEDPYAGTAYAGATDYGRERGQPGLHAGGYAQGEYHPGQENGADDYSAGYDNEYGDDPNASYEDDSYDERHARAERFAEPRRSRKGLVIAAVALGVVLAGGLGALALKGGSGSSSDGAPRVIAADEGPTKVQPAATPGDTEVAQNKLIYDRASPELAGDEQLVLPDDGPIDEAPASNESPASREIARIILPGAPGDASNPSSIDDLAGGAAATPAAPSDADAGPRKVRTVVVKPDGTIISSEAQPRTAGAPTDTSAPARSATPVATTPEAAAPVDEPVQTADAEPEAPAAATPPKDVSQLAAPAAAPAKPRVQPAAAAPAAATRAPTSGGFVVQVASQRTEEAAIASYKAMQRKFSSVFGSQEPNVVRADLGAKGIYYRARVGPMATRDQAVSFCESLRAAGGDCIVQKN
ncbi:SPOR domain-containing protein [Kaistia defluvii]|uniref:Cell division septation protein DedD n=1 Tax=Kaistia defluvii TaxID=410841 RepID=A0ABV2QW16_9HYPH